MENMTLEATKATPSVVLDESKNFLMIKGVSYPENAVLFYKPIIIWLKEYLTNLSEEAVLHLQIDYFNTSSSKCMIDIIDMFNEAYIAGKKVRINWYYHPKNPALLECGEEFKEDIEIPFEIIPSSL